MERRFAGKVAVVTGATQGMGQAIAVRLASEGALVAVNRKPDLSAEETLAMVKATGGEAFDVAADMRDPDQVKAMIAAVAKRGGRLDYVVSNAGINPFMTWDNTPIEEFNKLFETNVRGSWVVCTEGARQMISGGPWRRHRHDQLHLRPCRCADPGGLLRHQGRHQHAGQGAWARCSASTASASTRSSRAPSIPPWRRGCSNSRMS